MASGLAARRRSITGSEVFEMKPLYKGEREYTKEEQAVEEIDNLLKYYELDDACRDRVTDLIVAAFKNARRVREGRNSK